MLRENHKAAIPCQPFLLGWTVFVSHVNNNNNNNNNNLYIYIALKL